MNLRELCSIFHCIFINFPLKILPIPNPLYSFIATIIDTLKTYHDRYIESYRPRLGVQVTRALQQACQGGVITMGNGTLQ